MVAAFAPLEIPRAWGGAHVGVRLVEGFETLLALPGVGMRRAAGFWPRYNYEWEDLLAQQEQEADEKNKQQHAQNRVRLSPSVAEITNMETALAWPANYLRDFPALMRATNAVAFARAIGADTRFVVRRYGGKTAAWQRWHWEGCEIIAARLQQTGMAVF